MSIEAQEKKKKIYEKLHRGSINMQGRGKPDTQHER